MLEGARGIAMIARMRVRVIVLAIVVALMGVALWLSQRRHVEPKVSGFIEADEIRVGSRVGGRVAKVLVREGQKVKSGELLIELDPYDLNERRAQTAGELEGRKADLLKLKNGPRQQEITAAEARLRQAQSQVEVTAATERRLRQSFEHKAVSADELDNGIAASRSANATLDVRKAELDLLKAGTRAEEIAAAEAAVASATATLAALDKQTAELTVKAPVDGTIEAVELRPGDLVAANAPTLTVMDTGRLWVRAYVPENELNLANDQKVIVTVDSFAGRKFPAHISFVSTQAEFTPNNVQTPEERSKQVFRIKAELDEGLDVLRAGMAADVWLQK
jgi:multidrug resistance efflux pump